MSRILHGEQVVAACYDNPPEEVVAAVSKDLSGST